MAPDSDTVTALIRGPLVGTFLALILYGVTCTQAFFYFRTYHDGLRLKTTVALLMLLETAHAVMSMWVIDDYLVVHYGNLAALGAATWSSTSTYILGLLIDFYVYLYFTWRIWIFTKNKSIVLLMCALSLSRTAVSICASVLSVLKPSWDTYLDTSRRFLITGNLLFLLGDTFSACTMAYHLAKCRTGSFAPSRGRRIDAVLNWLLVFSVATGALTSVVDVIALVLTLAQPHSLAFLCAVLVQTHLYANALLASLNVRHAASRAYDRPPISPNTPQLDFPISLEFARPSDAESDEDEDEDGDVPGLGHTTAGSTDLSDDTRKSDISWQTVPDHRTLSPV